MKAVFLGTLAASQAAPITGFITEAVRTEIVGDGDPVLLAEAVADAEIVLTGAWRAGYPAAPRLRLLQVPLAGTDGIEVAALPKGVTLCNAYGHEPALGEFAIMMMLAWRHRLFDIATSFRAGSWYWSPTVGGPVRGEIGGRTVGVVGLGHIGHEVAWRAAALGCRVLAANRTARERPPSVERIFPMAELDQMLGECDVVVLSCALTAETTGLIDRRRLAAMKPDALLINLARGPIADEDALFEALRDGTIGGAALDTWWRYPSAAGARAAPVAPPVPRVAERHHDTALLAADRCHDRAPLARCGAQHRPLRARREARKYRGRDLRKTRMTDELAFLSATRLVALYREKTLSPVEVLTETLRRLEQYEGGGQRLCAVRPGGGDGDGARIRGALAQGRAAGPRRRRAGGDQGHGPDPRLAAPALARGRSTRARNGTRIRRSRQSCGRTARCCSARPRRPNSAGSP